MILSEQLSFLYVEVLFGSELKLVSFAFQSEGCEDIKGTLVKINYQHNCALIMEVSNFRIKSHFVYCPFSQYLLPLPTSAVP